MPLFSSGKKNPTELVKALHESLNIIDKEQSGKKNEKVWKESDNFVYVRQSKDLALTS